MSLRLVSRGILGFVVGASLLAGNAYAQLNPPGHGADVVNVARIAEVTNGPGGHWRLDDDVTDELGRNDGAIVGDVSFIDGVHGRAAMFDGDGDGVYLGDGDQFQFTGNHSTLMWIMPMDVPGIADGGVRTALSKVNDQERANRADEDTHGVYITNATGNELENPGGFVVGRGAHTAQVQSTLSAVDGQWHHIAVVYDEDNTRVVEDPDGAPGEQGFTSRTIYFDGVEDAIAEARQQDRQANEGPLKLGLGNLHTGENSQNWPGFQPGPGGGNGLGNAADCPRIIGAKGNTVEIPCRTPDYYGGIDDVRIIPGALSVEQIVAQSEDETPACAAAAAGVASAITGVTASPVDGEAGAVNVVAAVTGDPWITFVSTRTYADGEFMTEETMYTDVVIGPSKGIANQTIYLPAGEWVVTAYITDDLLCPETSSAQTAAFSLAELGGSSGPRVGETAGGFTFWFETENYTRYEDDNTDRMLPVSRWPDGVPDAQRGPFVFFFDQTDAFFGGGMRRDGGLDRTFSLFIVQWDVDIGLAGGEEGPHLLWSRCINSYNTSDFFLVEGDPNDEPIPEEYPFEKVGGYSNGDHRINEWNAGNPFPHFGAGATSPGIESVLPVGRVSGHNKDLQDGQNRLVLQHRQAGPGRGLSRTIFWDGILITNDLEVAPSDAEIKALTELKLFRRGDCNGDGAVDVSDPTNMLNFAFLGADAPACLEACDFNANGALDITTAVFAFNALFQGGPPIRAPRDCGFAAPLLGCEETTCTDADSPFPRISGGVAAGN